MPSLLFLPATATVTLLGTAVATAIASVVAATAIATLLATAVATVIATGVAPSVNRFVVHNLVVLAELSCTPSEECVVSMRTRVNRPLLTPS
eukprot:2919240-Pyramimonas_sp.AAC.1